MSEQIEKLVDMWGAGERACIEHSYAAGRSSRDTEVEALRAQIRGLKRELDRRPAAAATTKS